MTSLQRFEMFFTRKHFAKCDSLAVEELAQFHVSDPHERISRRLELCDIAFESLMRPFEHEHTKRIDDAAMRYCIDKGYL